MKRHGQMLLIFLLVFSTLSAQALDVYSLVTKSCRLYSGAPIASYMNPYSDALQNPLLASPIGQLSYGPNFKSGFVNMDYGHVDQMIKEINESPDLERALNACYGKNQDAKVNFLFLMNEIQFQAKADAVVLTVGTFILFEGAMARVAARIPFLASFTRGAMALKFMASLVIADASYVTLRALVNIVKLKRLTLHAHDANQMREANNDRQTLNDASIKEAEQNLEILRAFTMHDLESNIRSLKIKSATIKDPVHRAQIEDLIRKSEAALTELKAS